MKPFVRPPGDASNPVGDASTAHQRDKALTALYETLLANLNEGVFMTDGRGCFTYMNEAWETLTGWPASEALGMFCGTTVGPADRRAYRRDLINLLRGDASSHRCEARLLRRDGTTCWVQVSARRLEAGPDGRYGLVGTIVDISALKQAEEELRAAKHEAELANRAKTEFLSTISHELRTPLNAIIGLAESLLQTRLEADVPRTRKYLEIIHTAGRQLFLEINDLLDLARVEAGRLRLNPEKVEIQGVCSVVEQATRPAAVAKGIELAFAGSAHALTIEADEKLVTQAVQKLVTNAIKFTAPGGRVTVTTTVRPDASVSISVADTGIGIAPEHLHLLFRPFTQLDSSLSRRFGGTGLGLVLVDKFVRLHGGTVSVESRLNCGSTFTIVLPPCLPKWAKDDSVALS